MNIQRMTNQLIWICSHLGLGFFHTDRQTQADMQTNAQNDTSADLKLPMSGVGFLSHRQTQADRQTQLHRMTNPLICNCPRLGLGFFHIDRQTGKHKHRMTDQLILNYPRLGLDFFHTDRQANKCKEWQISWSETAHVWGWVSSMQTVAGRQANTTTRNDKSTDLKLPTSGVVFLPRRQTDWQTGIRRQANTNTEWQINWS